MHRSLFFFLPFMLSYAALGLQARAQNLIHNPNFDTDLASWTLPNPDVGSASWAALDARGIPSSGSALVRATGTWHLGVQVRLSQCVTDGLSPGQPYRYGLHYRIPPDQSAPGTVNLMFTLHADSQCTEPSQGGGVGGSVADDAWHPLTGSLVWPRGMGSAEVQVWVERPSPWGEWRAFIDQVILEAAPAASTTASERPPQRLAERAPVQRPPSPTAPHTLQNSLGMEFVLLPAGELVMEQSAFIPRHTVRISRPFYLGTYEVTQSQWQTVMGSNPSHFRGDATLPVEGVSWDDVQEFIRRLNAREGGTAYRLPTEAEWEYAVRAGTTTVYSFGDDVHQLPEYAWYTKNAEGRTHPVGQLKPNEWGLYDMLGNVSEWVQDKACPDVLQCMGLIKAAFTGPITDPQGPEVGTARVRRGGSAFSYAGECQSSWGTASAPGSRADNIGFRLLRALP